MSRRSQARAEARRAAQSARRQRRRPDRMLVSAIMLFFFTAFLLVSFNGELEWEGFALAVIVPVLIRLSTMWVPRFFPADKLLLAMGTTIMLGIQTFIIIGGVLKLIPLTGVTMPFVSYGGTSLVSCMGLIGLIQGVASVNQDDLAYDYEISHTLQEEAMMPEADRE